MNPPVDRILGSHDGEAPGPTLLAQGGIHGNEPGGVLALQRVLARLDRGDIALRGRLVAVAGNRKALAAGERFLDRDLNRRWTTADIAALLGRPDGERSPEDQEQIELLEVYQRVEEEAADTPLLFVDLHSSSADGAPFSCLGDTLPNRRIARSLPMPVILGLEECIDGAVMDWFNRGGHGAIAIEGGQHQAESTADHLEIAVWLVMAAAGMLDREAQRTLDLEKGRDRLARAADHLPPILEIRHRQAIREEDRFVMKPGFASFDPVRRGDHLAEDRNGSLHAGEDGFMLLPLYQGQGQDGYFLARPVRPFWLTVSGCIRKLRFDRLLPLLPGVRRHPERDDSLLADPHVARWFAVEIFHLLGFRRRRDLGDQLLFTRRWANPKTRRLGR